MTDLPAEMVERAMHATDDHDTYVASDGIGWDCSCGAGETRTALDRTGDEQDLRDADRHKAGAVLAAALEGCEVREEWLVLVDGSGRVGTVVVMDEDESRDYIEEQIRDAGQYPRWLGRRLVIATAPERVEPAGTS